MHMPFTLYCKGKTTPHLVNIQLESTYKGDCAVTLDVSALRGPAPEPRARNSNYYAKRPVGTITPKPSLAAVRLEPLRVRSVEAALSEGSKTVSKHCIVFITVFILP